MIKVAGDLRRAPASFENPDQIQLNGSNHTLFGPLLEHYYICIVWSHCGNNFWVNHICQNINHDSMQTTNRCSYLFFLAVGEKRNKECPIQ